MTVTTEMTQDEQGETNKSASAWQRFARAVGHFARDEARATRADFTITARLKARVRSLEEERRRERLLSPPLVLTRRPGRIG